MSVTEYKEELARELKDLSLSESQLMAMAQDCLSNTTMTPPAYARRFRFAYQMGLDSRPTGLEARRPVEVFEFGYITHDGYDWLDASVWTFLSYSGKEAIESKTLKDLMKMLGEIGWRFAGQLSEEKHYIMQRRVEPSSKEEFVPHEPLSVDFLPPNATALLAHKLFVDGSDPFANAALYVAFGGKYWRILGVRPSSDGRFIVYRDKRASQYVAMLHPNDLVYVVRQ